MKKKSPNNFGFTLVETMIALFLFIILITITGSVFLDGLRNQRRAFALQSLVENMNLILESMTKEILVAEIINTPDNSCGNNASNTIAFKHPILGEISYFLDNERISKSIGGQSDRLTSQNIKITSLGFCVSGNSLGDGKQARVIIFGKMTSGQEGQILELPFQTAISPRLLND